MTKEERRDRQKRSMHGVQGEGNPVADEEYRERTRDFVEADRVPEAAREAERAVHGDEAEELAEAEREALSRKRGEDV